MTYTTLLDLMSDLCPTAQEYAEALAGMLFRTRGAERIEWSCSVADGLGG